MTASSPIPRARSPSPVCRPATWQVLLTLPDNYQVTTGANPAEVLVTAGVHAPTWDCAGCRTPPPTATPTPTAPRPRPRPCAGGLPALVLTGNTMDFVRYYDTYWPKKGDRVDRQRLELLARHVGPANGCCRWTAGRAGWRRCCGAGRAVTMTDLSNVAVARAQARGLTPGSATSTPGRCLSTTPASTW